MKKYYILVLAVLSVVVLSAFLVHTKFNYFKQNQKVLDPEGSSLEKNDDIKGKIIFINGDERAEYDYNAEDKSTVFELMKSMSKESKINFEYQESNAGVFIGSINNVKNDVPNNKFWMLYVNGELASVGASDYKLSDGDTVEWKYIDTSQIKL